MLDHILGKVWAAKTWLLPAAEGQSPCSPHLLALSTKKKPLQQKRKAWNFSIQGMHDKHWLAVSQGKVESQEGIWLCTKKCAPCLGLLSPLQVPFLRILCRASESQEQALRLKANKLYRLWKQDKAWEPETKKGGVSIHSHSLRSSVYPPEPPLIQWPTAALELLPPILNLLILFSTFLWVADDPMGGHRPNERI